MFKKTIPFYTICLGFAINCFAQDPIQTKQYPKNFFRYPLDLPPSTAGSFGELRPEHFHSGLDFKTNSRTGYPVHAAYDGYISRLRVQFGGFGNAIYVTHPNGFTTVYGHIERFDAKLEEIVRKQQYDSQSFEVDFKLPPTQVMVCKDDVIAWSGNAGASAGPHLHFEIRDTQTEQTINPQLFGLTIPDHVPPALGAICVYRLSDAPFSEKTPRQFFAVAGAAGHYHLTKPQVINVSGETGFGITATDMNSASFNHNGIYSIELKVDGTTVYTFAVERFAFDQTHSINAYIDYPIFLSSHRFIQKCFILPGSKITLYPQSVNRGVVNFTDDAIHDVQYVVKDVAGNTSTLNIKVKSSTAKIAAVPTSTGTTLFHYDRQNEFNADNLKVVVPKGNLYDDLNFTYSASPGKPGMYSAIHHLHNHLTPINDTFQIWIKPDEKIGNNIGKAVIMNANGVCEGGTYDNGYIKASARTFGDYYIRVDSVPPVIHSLNIKNGSNMAKMQRIALKIGDNMSGVKTYTGKIDGKWVLMEWDYKTKVLSYKFDKDLASGKHIFDLTVTDNKDNISQFSAYFFR
ncbi:peptidoglycan DD-metalloendopeptidase family protein [Mucilaginibacter sp. BT774]|uniref:peptidoglycan DD-metalloendopeptidase family protein n=1 Tax=Mucilaginibacter sp. BT774 TaxID=3062276 RepID=UPI002676110C|nr:peptidoglycan DD-metalloendopeptidase family protein [Mucilaginibacter sp. BT774]MDO3625978.1 peptidoglycan DD-metalloendopeptidase family protein [Mucilaginibacter sp. BT774]